MARSKTPGFVTTIELWVSPQNPVVLHKRFDAARLVYNPCLSYYLKRVQPMRESNDYQRYKGMKRRSAVLEQKLSKLDREPKRLQNHTQT